ncbi:MAG: 50S ribosomal protein L19e [Nanoarchaeota archaeon]|nr:50S ribosomal protein L19e [Nanoarchaeota archaeon]
MNLGKKKILAAKTLQVGKERIVFNIERLNEIKEAITKQDIRDLFNNKAIFIKEVNGRKKIEKRKNRRRKGSIKKSIKRSKEKYMILARKLRAYLFELRRKDLLPPERYNHLRRQIKAGVFKSKNHLKESIGGFEK